MNNLEYINDIINLYRKEIKRLKKSIESTLPIHEKAIESLTRNREEVKKELKILEQIKTELEAWYSVKSGLIYEKENKNRMSEENRYSYIIYLTDDEMEMIQKALEVKDELKK